MKRLVELCDIQYGYAFDSNHFTEDKSFPQLVRIRDVKKGYSETYYNGEYPEEYVLSNGDLLIGMDGEFNIARWKVDGALLNQRVCKVIVKNGINEEYIRFFMIKCLKKIEEKTSFATVKHLSAKELNRIELDLPSIDEQNIIASLLSKLEMVIELRNQELQSLDNLIKARFVEMFGELKTNIKGWNIKTFEELAYLITDGEHATPRRSTEGIYLLSARNVLNHSLQLEDVDYIDQQEYNRIAKRVIPQEGDVLISCSGTVGRCCSVPADFKFQMVRSVALIRFKEKINPVFAEYMITSNCLQNQINSSKTASSQANLFQGKIKVLKGFVPPIELQNQFADFVHQVNKSKVAVKKALDETQILFDSLMQKYFG